MGGRQEDVNWGGIGPLPAYAAYPLTLTEDEWNTLANRKSEPKSMDNQVDTVFVYYCTYSGGEWSDLIAAEIDDEGDLIEEVLYGANTDIGEVHSYAMGGMGQTVKWITSLALGPPPWGYKKPRYFTEWGGGSQVGQMLHKGTQTDPRGKHREELSWDRVGPLAHDAYSLSEDEWNTYTNRISVPRALNPLDTVFVSYRTYFRGEWSDPIAADIDDEGDLIEEVLYDENTDIGEVYTVALGTMGQTVEWRTAKDLGPPPWGYKKARMPRTTTVHGLTNSTDNKGNGGENILEGFPGVVDYSTMRTQGTTEAKGQRNNADTPNNRDTSNNTLRINETYWSTRSGEQLNIEDINRTWTEDTISAGELPIINNEGAATVTREAPQNNNRENKRFERCGQAKTQRGLKPSGDHEITIGTINVNGLSNTKNKSGILYETLLGKQLDIIVVVEHQRGNKNDIPMFRGYQRWAICRTKERKGGIAIYVKQGRSIRAWLLTEEKWPDDMMTEQLWIAIQMGSVKCAVGGIYIRPVSGITPIEYGTRYIQNLETQVRVLQEKEYNVILMGDFNAKLENPMTPEWNPDIWGQQLTDMVNSCDITVCNLLPHARGAYTRIANKENERNSVIDYIMIQGDDIECVEFNVDETRRSTIESDHVLLLAKLKVTGTRQRTHDVQRKQRWRSLKQVDWRIFQDQINARLITEQPGDAPTVQDEYNQLKDILRECGIQTIGKMRVRDPHSAPSDSRELQILRNQLRQIRTQLKHTQMTDNGSDEHKELKCREWITRKQVRVQERVENTERLQTFAESLIASNRDSLDRMYRYVRRKCKQPLETFVLKDTEGQIITEPGRIKEQLRTQWNKIYNKQFWDKARHIEPDATLRIGDESHREMGAPIELEEVKTAIKELHAGTSAGTTDIPPELIQHGGENMVEAIHEWCVRVWEQEVLPQENDVTESRFLHKKGATDNLGNYRTLATGCNLCKVFLRVMYNRLQTATEENNLLGEIQNGFRKGRRAADNILTVETVIRKMKRANHRVYVALLDITKAYDRICRDSLWFKLERYGFHDKMIRMLKGVYREPMSKLIFQDITTEPLAMILGLRQGCVLSPILFALYLADLGRILEKCDLGVEVNGSVLPGMFFADDMVLWGQQYQLQNLLQIVASYAEAWKIEFSGEKSSVIPVGRTLDNERERWYLGYKPIRTENQAQITIKEEPSGRYLGVTIGRVEPIYKEQYKIAITRANRGAALIRYLLNPTCNPLTLLKKLWCGYIVPGVLYGSDVITWNVCTIQKLERIQRSLIRNTLRLPQYVANVALYQLTGIMPIVEVICKNRMNYRQYIRDTPEERWVHKAYAEQAAWAIEDNVIDNWEANHVVSHKYFFAETYTMMRARGLPWDGNFSKAIIKRKCLDWVTTRIDNTMAQRSTLQYMDDKFGEPDHKYMDTNQQWWLKARTGGIFTRARVRGEDPRARVCPICNEAEETMQHFLLECGPLNHYSKLQWRAPSEREYLQWAFSIKASIMFRAWLSTWIHQRWKKHEYLTQNRVELDLLITNLGGGVLPALGPGMNNDGGIADQDEDDQDAEDQDEQEA